MLWHSYFYVQSKYVTISRWDIRWWSKEWKLRGCFWQDWFDGCKSFKEGVCIRHIFYKVPDMQRWGWDLDVWLAFCLHSVLKSIDIDLRWEMSFIFFLCWKSRGTSSLRGPRGITTFWQCAIHTRISMLLNPPSPPSPHLVALVSLLVHSKSSRWTLGPWQTMRGVTKALSSLRPAGCFRFYLHPPPCIYARFRSASLSLSLQRYIYRHRFSSHASSSSQSSRFNLCLPCVSLYARLDAREVGPTSFSCELLLMLLLLTHHYGRGSINYTGNCAGIIYVRTQHGPRRTRGAARERDPLLQPETSTSRRPLRDPFSHLCTLFHTIRDL